MSANPVGIQHVKEPTNDNIGAENSRDLEICADVSGVQPVHDSESKCCCVYAIYRAIRDVYNDITKSITFMLLTAVYSYFVSYSSYSIYDSNKGLVIALVVVLICAGTFKNCILLMVLFQKCFVNRSSRSRPGRNHFMFVGVDGDVELKVYVQSICFMLDAMELITLGGVVLSIMKHNTHSTIVFSISFSINLASVMMSLLSVRKGNYVPIIGCHCFLMMLVGLLTGPCVLLWQIFTMFVILCRGTSHAKDTLPLFAAVSSPYMYFHEKIFALTRDTVPYFRSHGKRCYEKFYWDDRQTFFDCGRSLFVIKLRGMSGKTALVFLHGSGGDGHEVKSFLDCLPLADFGYETFTDVAASIGMDIITPTSDVRRYTAMNYERLNIWFDRTAKFFTKDGLDDKEDLEGVELSLSKIFKIMEEIEPRYDNIFLGGHSMGGVLMLHVLRKNVSPKVRGIFSISSCLLNRSEVFLGPGLGSAAKLPLIMMHGKHDDMIPCDWTSKTASALLVLGVDVQFRSYDAYHGLEEEELSDLMHWMQDILLTNLQSRAGVASGIGGESAQKADEDSGDEEEEQSTGEDGKQAATVASVNRLLNKTILDSSNSAAAAPVATKPVECVPYTIEYNSSNSTQVTIKYSVPQDYIGLMASRPILACGSQFEIVPDPPHGVKTSLISSDPDKTATEIGKRLYFRASSGSATLNPCQMS